MKHLLFIIPIFLFSSLIISKCEKKEKTLYLWETSSGIVWKGFGEKETHPIYKGDVENGVPNGVGIINYLGERTYVRFLEGKYVGDWMYLGKWKYVGEWKSGEYHGQGTYSIGGNKFQEGEWKDGILWNGKGYGKYGNIVAKVENGESTPRYMYSD